jgi:hypothetical protein
MIGSEFWTVIIEHPRHEVSALARRRRLAWRHVP